VNSNGPPASGDGLLAAQAYADRMAGATPRRVFSPRRTAVDEVRLYAVDTPAAWLLVTLGLADLGFELTCRLPRGDDELPVWAVDCLLSLGAYARHSGHGFADGDQIDLRGPIKLDSGSAITAAAVVSDPVLKKLGKVTFLQVVGLTADELELCRSWRTAAVVGLLRRRDPLLITVLDRPSLLEDRELRSAAETGVAAEGSSLDDLRVATLSWRWRGRARWRVLVVTLGAGAATALGPALRRKLTHPGATFGVIGDEGEVRFSVGAGAGDSWRVDGAAVVVELAAASVEALADLFDGKTGTGSLPSLAGLRFTVIP
jgi:suppressor of fused